MTPINIEWLTDSHACELCGVSYSDGALVTGAVNLEFPAVAHCYGGSDMSQTDVYKAILAELGYVVLENY